jgi:hypothetical protein
MRTEYSNVILPSGTIGGANLRALSVRGGYKLTRVTEEGRDDLIVERNARVFEIAWSQVKGGVRALESKPSVAKAKKPAAE